DDGAGVAVGMGGGGLIYKLGPKPGRAVRGVGLVNEEKGLAGGGAYSAGQAAEIKKHVAAVESDLWGGHPTRFLAHIHTAGLQSVQPIAEILKASGAGLIKVTDGAVGADISPLDAAGVPGFSPLQDSRTYFNYHHTAADTLDKVSPRELAENCAVMALLAYSLATIPDPPRLKAATLGGP